MQNRRIRDSVVLVIVVLLLPSPSRAQTVNAFVELPLRVNLDDQLQVQEQSGAAYTGRLTRLTRGDLTIETRAGERRFTSEVVQAVAVRRHPLRAGGLIGAGGLAVLGASVVCWHKGGSDCALTGALGAAPIGAGLGLVIGSLVSRMEAVYATRDSRPASTSRMPPDAPSLLEDLALHVNLNDHLRVEDQSGRQSTGRLTGLTPDEVTIHTAVGDQHFTRTALRQVALRRRHLRAGTLIGAGTGAIYGAVSACRPGPRDECPDGVIIGTALGAGAGILVAALFNSTKVVYPEPEKRTLVSPLITRGAIAITVSRLW